ncbi:sensor histidine kinase [Polaribacter sp.]|uniref:sensor histidine kinase n=1 Tax=Polaribacter sp. TaxID=1920175 RepID=UPI003F6CD058
MRLFLLAFIFFVVVNSYGQNAPNNNYTHKVEEFILEKKIDSALYFLDSITEISYKNRLNKFFKKENLTYQDYYAFISRLGNRQSVKYTKVSDYINQEIKKPSSKKINLDYVEIKWTQVSKLRDEVGLDEASKVQKDLESYINQFDDKKSEVLKAKTKIRTHPVVMYLIEQDVIKGKELVNSSLKVANKLNDKELQIIFLYHLTDFLLLEGKLQEYIDVSEKSLALEKELPKHTNYYYSIIEHLIDAYVYKGGHNDRVIKLINILYENPATRIHTYSLYAKIISTLDKNSLLKENILKKFQVTTLPKLATKLRELGKNLNPNDFYHVINESSRALAKHGYTDLALNYKDEAIQITRKIYSKDLSNSLANYKTEQAVKKKEIEIQHEKERKTLYGVIAILAFVFFVISLLVLIKIKKQSKELSSKNKIIAEALKEKELLVKEVHHRVKNNFQIVSSLLELQSRGIEDKKALELANEGKNRVKSMALIHQKLYQNETGLVDFDEYIQQLTKELSSLYATKDGVETTVSSKNIKFDVDTAIPLGLILNEIITNSYKYAFRNNTTSKLSVAINKEKDDNYKLVVEDNGPGLSKDFDVKKAKSLGLRLVNRLVKQLHGHLKQTNNSGAKFEIYFKDTNSRRFVN